MLTNAGLAVLIENINGPRQSGQTDQDIDLALRQRQNTYFTFILWATFGLSFVRFMGVSVFSCSFISFELTEFCSASTTGFAVTSSDGSDATNSIVTLIRDQANQWITTGLYFDTMLLSTPYTLTWLRTFDDTRACVAMV